MGTGARTVQVCEPAPTSVPRHRHTPTHRHETPADTRHVDTHTHTYRHTNRQTDTHIDGQTDRHTDTYADRQTSGLTEGRIVLVTSPRHPTYHPTPTRRRALTEHQLQVSQQTTASPPAACAAGPDLIRLVPSQQRHEGARSCPGNTSTIKCEQGAAPARREVLMRSR